MIRLPWRTGSAPGSARVFLSATRFTYRSLRSMPAVFAHGLQLRAQWPMVDGAIGMRIAASLRDRTTYTLTVWSSEQDLDRWLVSPYHARLMREFRDRLESSCAVSWTAETFHPREAWTEGMRRLRARDQRMASDCPHTPQSRSKAQGGW
jgi:hypothetical protein